MLSDSTLERVSVAYRKGYRDGCAARDKFCEVRPECIKPFASFDYEEGYKAGVNAGAVSATLAKQTDSL